MHRRRPIAHHMRIVGIEIESLPEQIYRPGQVVELSPAEQARRAARSAAQRAGARRDGDSPDHKALRQAHHEQGQQLESVKRKLLEQRAHAERMDSARKQYRSLSRALLAYVLDRLDADARALVARARAEDPGLVDEAAE